MDRNFIDLRQDTWAASDDLNRQLPLNVDVKDKDRKVGIFYFMWHKGTGELMDHSLAYATGGIEEFEKVMQQGRLGFSHYWAEPYFGYYCSDDEWVIRKHIYQLANAGVDFIFFDVTIFFIKSSLRIFVFYKVHNTYVFSRARVRVFI